MFDSLKRSSDSLSRVAEGARQRIAQAALLSARLRACLFVSECDRPDLGLSILELWEG